jgi:hypothetical protein
MNANPVHHETSKHCDLADHFVREQVERDHLNYFCAY